MELVRISPSPRQLRDNSRNAPELLPDRSGKAPGQLPEIPKKCSPAAPTRLPESCRPASREIRQTIGQLSGSPVFLYFIILFPFFDIFHNGWCPDIPKKLRTCPIASRELLPGFLQQQLLYSSFSGDLREPSVIEKLRSVSYTHLRAHET